MMNFGGKEKIIYHITREQFAEVKEAFVIFSDKNEILKDYVTDMMRDGNDIFEEVMKMSSYNGNYANKLIAEDTIHVIKVDGDKNMIYARSDDGKVIEKLKEWNIDNLVNSKDSNRRKQAVEVGDEAVWEALIDDRNTGVKIAIAKRYYGLDRLVNDENQWVQSIALRCKQELENRTKREVNDTLDEETTLDELGLTTRANVALRRSGIGTLGGLMDLSVEDIERIRNVGSKTAAEIVRVQKIAIEELENGKSLSVFLKKKGL